jgi:hypothetical protein
MQEEDSTAEMEDAFDMCEDSGDDDDGRDAVLSAMFTPSPGSGEEGSEHGEEDDNDDDDDDVEDDDEVRRAGSRHDRLVDDPDTQQVATRVLGHYVGHLERSVGRRLTARRIRRTVVAALQLATIEGVPMTYQHLERAVAIQRRR